MNNALTKIPESDLQLAEDLRRAPRCTLMIRGAKLLCEDKEYLCIVRDVSETGVRLKVFHEIPAERQHMALQLANGDTHPIEPVWERNSEAGFRLVAPIEVHEFIEEASPYPRRSLRLHLEREALVEAGQLAIPAKLLDLSQHGARIETAQPLAVRQKVKLDADGLPELQANVRWRRGCEHGLIFQQSFSFDALARLAAQLQCDEPAIPLLS